MLQNEGLRDLANLAGDLHRAGISLTLDLVLNHVAREHEWAEKAKAGDAIKKAHDGYHDFTHGVWEHLYDEAGLTSGTASHGH